MARNSGPRIFSGKIAIAAATVAFATVAVAVDAAKAVILLPGETTNAPGDPLAPASPSPDALSRTFVPDMTGTVSLPTGPIVVPDPAGGVAFTATDGSFSGFLNYQVYQDTPTSPTLDFVYWVDVTTANVLGLGNPDHLSLFSFANFNTDIDYGGTGVAPSDATRGTFNNGQTLGFDFSEPAGIGAGSDSVYLIVKTNSLMYTSGMANLIDGGVSSNGVPVPYGSAVVVVPEPATLGVVTVVAGLLLRRRNRRI